MPPYISRLLFIFVLIFILNTIRFFISGRTTNNKLEKPSLIQRVALGVQVTMTILIALMVVIGILMQDTEMIIVSSIILLIFVIIVFGTRRKFKKYYSENDTYFYLEEQYIFNKVSYENITDWIPLRKKIGVLDPTQSEDIYLVINFAFHDPKILLTHLAEMTFAGKFKQTDALATDDPYRKQEFINHLQKNGYDSIVDEYMD